MRLSPPAGKKRSRDFWRRHWWLGPVLSAYLMGAASAQAQPFVYIVNDVSGSVSQYDAMGGALSPLAPPTLPTGLSPFEVAISPDAKSVYVTNGDGHSVSQYDVGVSGALTPKTPATVATGSVGGSPRGVAISPDGKSVYVANGFDNTVSQYDVGVGGTLTPKTPATVAADNVPVGISVSPDGKSAYVASEFDNAVSQYDVRADGTLTPKTPATVATAGFPVVSIAVSPNSRNAYVASTGNGGAGFPGMVSQYDIDPLTGALSAKTPASVPAGAGPPGGLAVSPDGKSVYVTNSGDNTVSQYDVGVGGVLTPKTPATVVGVTSPAGLAVSPDGKSVYVTNESSAGTVSQFDVGVGGMLNPKTPVTVATGSVPIGIAVTPLPRVPTSKDQCKHGGWRDFGQFKNQGQCVAFVEHGARRVCLAERAQIGRAAFRLRYGQGRRHLHALRRCVAVHAG